MTSTAPSPEVLQGVESSLLSVQNLLAGSLVTHAIAIPASVLSPRVQDRPQDELDNGGTPNTIRLRPLSLASMTLISQAAREDSSLIPALMVKEALVEPQVSFDQVRQMHVGLVHYLVGQINRISGLGADGEVLTAALESPLGQTHLLLAKHFGWTPDQVSQLTPAQVAVYLAGIESLLNLEAAAAEAN